MQKEDFHVLTHLLFLDIFYRINFTNHFLFICNLTMAERTSSICITVVVVIIENACIGTVIKGTTTIKPRVRRIHHIGPITVYRLFFFIIPYFFTKKKAFRPFSYINISTVKIINRTTNNSSTIFQIYFIQSLYDTFKYASESMIATEVGATNITVAYNDWNITAINGYSFVSVTIDAIYGIVLWNA